MKKDRNVYRMLAMVTQFGIHMIVPIFMCSFVGIYIDRKLGTSFFMILLFFLGAAAGFRNIYILATRETHNKEEEGRNARKHKEDAADR